MTKNITVGIPDELAKRMDELTEVNWSAVTRDCIEQYLKQRTAENLEKIIAKVKQKRSNDFKKGYEFVLKNIDNFELPELEEIAWPDQDKEKYAVRLYQLFIQRRLATRTLIKTLLRYTEDEYGDVTDIKFIISSEFLKGMHEAAKEIVEKSK
jgi:Arc/MetJ-type ribon-helix-helix transcriptional regulator